MHVVHAYVRICCQNDRYIDRSIRKCKYIYICIYVYIHILFINTCVRAVFDFDETLTNYCRNYVCAACLNNDDFAEAKNFFRRSLEIANIYHHIGIYCYSIDTLKKFVELNQSKKEIENRLEQLRALDNNIVINVALANLSPIGVDTEEDYLALKKIM